MIQKRAEQPFFKVNKHFLVTLRRIKPGYLCMHDTNTAIHKYFEVWKYIDQCTIDIDWNGPRNISVWNS